jgi:CBS domain-containing protein
MFSIRTVLKKKKNPSIETVGPDSTVLEAIKHMAECRIGALLVMEAGKVVGIVSERDYARKVILAGRRSAETRVREIMSEEVVTATADMTARDGLEIMTEKFIRHLPVFENGELVGMVSIGDLVKTVIAEQDALIEQLEAYVSGSG